MQYNNERKFVLEFQCYQNGLANIKMQFTRLSQFPHSPHSLFLLSNDDCLKGNTSTTA